MIRHEGSAATAGRVSTTDGQSLCRRFGLRGSASQLTCGCPYLHSYGGFGDVAPESGCLGHLQPAIEGDGTCGGLGASCSLNNDEDGSSYSDSYCASGAPTHVLTLR